MLALASLITRDPIGMMVGFLVFIICVAIVIIGVRWLMALAGIAVPQPLMVIIGLILFLVFLLFFLDWSGLWAWGPR